MILAYPILIVNTEANNMIPPSSSLTLDLLIHISWIDDIGNVHGRVNGGNASAPALLFGSHLV